MTTTVRCGFVLLAPRRPRQGPIALPQARAAAADLKKSLLDPILLCLSRWNAPTWESLPPPDYTKTMSKQAPLFFGGLVILLAGAARNLAAQSPCNNTPAYSPCELVFELSEQDAAAHPNPYLTVELKAEFRSPR